MIIQSPWPGPFRGGRSGHTVPSGREGAAVPDEGPGAEQAEQAAERGHELLFAAGWLAWRPAEGPPVHDHLLHTPVRIVVDERTERVDVVLAGHTSLRDRELLADRPEFKSAGWVSDAVQAGQGFGLNASVGDVLRKWCSIAFASPAAAEGAVYREDWAPDPTGALPSVPRVRLAPAPV